MSTERERRFAGPRRGQLPFALAFLGVSAVLLSQIGNQTTWVEGSRLFAQPRFWPAVGILSMVVLGGLHLVRLPWRRFTRFDRVEGWKWLSAVEFALWFMAYVLTVPIIGYLPVTLIFLPALTWRMGYRTRGMIALSLGLGLAIVVMFKSVLSVRIPGGAIYDYLPDGLRSFFILNF